MFLVVGVHVIIDLVCWPGVAIITMSMRMLFVCVWHTYLYECVCVCVCECAFLWYQSCLCL